VSLQHRTSTSDWIFDRLTSSFKIVPHTNTGECTPASAFYTNASCGLSSFYRHQPRLLMGRRKRQDDDFVVRRKIMPAPQRNRVITVHTTPSGRLGQAISFASASIAPRASHSTIVVPAPEDVCPDTAPNDTASNDTAPNHSFQEPYTEYTDAHSDLGDTTGPISNPDPPLLDWMSHHRDTYLDELIRHDGRGGTELCANCGETGLFKCKDCFGYRLLCKNCFTDTHALLPFHRPLVCFLFLLVSIARTHLVCSTGQANSLTTSPSSRSVSNSNSAIAGPIARYLTNSPTISP
jgi:hypothetical protein